MLVVEFSKIDFKKKRAGAAYHIPSNVRHGFSVEIEEPVEYIEVFSPPEPGNIY